MSSQIFGQNNPSSNSQFNSPPNNSPFGSNNSGGGFGGPSGNGSGTGPGGARRISYSTDFGKLFLICSIIAAIVFLLLGELIYHTSITRVNSILFMGFYFAVFGVILWLFLFLAARIKELKFSKKSIIIPLICIVALFLLGMLFEFLYELNVSSSTVQTGNYIFVLDNSGSMQDNDPYQKRISAVKEILEDKDENFQFAVYSFGDELLRIRDMAPLSRGIGDLNINPNGGTPILGILEKVLNDMDRGEISYNEGTQVILLTDGVSTDTDLLGMTLNNLIKEFKQKKVSVSTVGLGAVDEAFLNEISDKTNGLSITVDDVSKLQTAMSSVIRTTDADYNLLSARNQANLNWLRGILRVLFLFLLGAVLTVIKLAVVDESANFSLILISSGIACLLASLLMEIGLNLFLTGFAGRVILVLLFSLMLTTLQHATITQGGGGTISRL